MEINTEPVRSKLAQEHYTTLQEFLSVNKSREVNELAAHYPQKKSLEVDFVELSKFNPMLADELLANPDAFIDAAEKILAGLNPQSIITTQAYKPHFRPFNLPDVSLVRVQDLGAGCLDKLIKVEGVTSWVTDIYPIMKVSVWECEHCWSITKLTPSKVEPLKAPPICKCSRNKFRLVEEKSEFVNLQRARVQELVERMTGGSPTVHVDAWMEDDLTNMINPGEKLVISAILRLKPNKDGKGRSSVYNKFLDVIHVYKMQQEFEMLEISKEEEEQIRALASKPNVHELISQSIAPSIYGYQEMKQAIALQLFGGTPGKVLPDGQRIRSDIHTLLVGDPGCLIAGERVVLGDGRIVKIETLGQKHLQDVKIQILTGQGGKKRDLATCFHKYENQPVIELILESGKKIAGTYNHPLMLISTESGTIKREWKQLQELKIGDKLQTITYIPCTVTKEIPTNFKSTKNHFGPKFKGILPQTVSPQLAAFMGYVTGDGWVQKYRVGFVVNDEEKDLMPILVDYVQTLFGIIPAITPRKLPGRTMQLYYANIGSQTIASNLHFLREKRVPDLIFQSGNKVASEYLKWLFEADGTVFNNGRGKRAIGLKAKNLELLRDVQTLLLRFSIHSRIVGNALLIRRGFEIQKFAKHIGFASNKKKTKLANLAKSAEDFARFGNQLSERIVKINKLPAQTVYDIEVPKTHQFIANGIISHNTAKSSIIQYIMRLAPKAIFTSGKGASGVGLTASAEKDEIGGGWILKAGAMVLASGGIIGIDEFDKMEKEDRSALHEAMEQQKISIAKAGIVTTFTSRTAVLAAANPKFGRFDPNAPPATQFEIPPTLLSRFDLIFTIKDTIEESRDRRMAEHILLGHTIAAQKLKPADDSAILPEVTPELLRKYIAYARRSVFPILTNEAVEKVKTYYLELRQMGKKNNTFPVTARQIEGIIRLSEASAKLRLSERVELSDAERAVALSEFVLRDVFTDKETGLIDSDIITIGQPKSKIDKVRSLLSIIQSLEKEFDLVDIDDVVKKASEVSIDDATARKHIDELKRVGDLYEPKPGYIKSARKKESW